MESLEMYARRDVDRDQSLGALVLVRFSHVSAGVGPIAVRTRDAMDEWDSEAQPSDWNGIIDAEIAVSDTHENKADLGECGQQHVSTWRVPA